LQQSNVYSQIKELLNYEPKVGILGKTGVGKSSLCNSLFGKDTAKVDDVAGCTKNPQEVFLPFAGETGVKLIDCPGIGENDLSDKEYIALYKSLIPQFDLILWVVKADDRALAEEERAYKNIVRPTMKVGIPFIVAVNQVDKMEPYKEWDFARSVPSQTQSKNVTQKVKIVQKLFNLIDGKVLAVSATEKYGLRNLVDEIVRLLPKEKRLGFVNNLLKDVVSEETKRLAQEAYNEKLRKILIGVGVTAAVAGGIWVVVALGPEIVAGLAAAGKVVAEVAKDNKAVKTAVQTAKKP
jgi:uncharacterized protein